MNEGTRRASADVHQRGVAEAMKEKRGRVGQEMQAIGAGEVATCVRENVKQGGGFASESRGSGQEQGRRGRRRRGDEGSRILLD
jgi:hypothetical protein